MERGAQPGLVGAVTRRELLGGPVALGIITVALPTAAAAASPTVQTVACTTPVLTQVPFVAQGTQATVGAVTVTAPTNTARGVPDFPQDQYWPHSPSENVTVLEVSPPVAGIEFATAFHGDAGGGRSETLTFIGESLAGTELFRDDIVDAVTTVQRPTAGAFVPELARLTVTFTLTGGTTETVTASRFMLRILTC